MSPPPGAWPGLCDKSPCRAGHLQSASCLTRRVMPGGLPNCPMLPFPPLNMVGGSGVVRTLPPRAVFIST